MVLKNPNGLGSCELINGAEKEPNGLERIHLINGVERMQWSWKVNWWMVLKEPNGLERSKLKMVLKEINGLERFHLVLKEAN